VGDSECCPSLFVEPPEVCERGESEAYSSWTQRCIVVSKRVITRRSNECWSETRQTFLLLYNEYEEGATWIVRSLVNIHMR
jgi:hypothetical protein